MKEQERVYVPLQKEHQRLNLVRIGTCVHETVPVLCEVREYELSPLAILEHKGCTARGNFVWVMTAISEVLKQAPQSEKRVIQVCGIQRSDISKQCRLNVLPVWHLGESCPQVPCELLESGEPWLVGVQAGWLGVTWVIPIRLSSERSRRVVDGVER